MLRVHDGWVVCLSIILMLVWAESGLTQVIGEEREMDRLEQRADDAIAGGDPEGAALSIGKAAFMATLISQKEGDAHSRLLYRATETLFRGQEQAYRALALFEQAGGQLPASQGVCQFLTQAADKIKESANALRALGEVTNASLKERQQRHIGKTQEWKSLLLGLHQDFSC